MIKENEPTVNVTIRIIDLALIMQMMKLAKSFKDGDVLHMALDGKNVMKLANLGCYDNIKQTLIVPNHSAIKARIIKLNSTQPETDP